MNGLQKYQKKIQTLGDISSPLYNTTTLWFPISSPFFPFFLQQMSAAVRADFHENSLSSGNQGKQSSNNKLCQDGATSKVISVILGCASKTHSDLEIRSSCLEDVDFPKGA